MLNLRRLTVLREVVRHGSFSAAAEILCQSPSAVSQAMHALERESGTTLFERMGGGVRVTPAGRALEAHAEAILARVAAAEADLLAIGAGRQGRLRLGSFPTATDAFAARAVEAFRRRQPLVEVHFRAGTPAESLNRMRASELDLAVVFELDRWTAEASDAGHARTMGRDVECHRILDEPYVVVMPADHRLADADAVEVSALKGERLLGRPPDCPPWGPDLRHACRIEGFEPRLEPLYTSSTFRDVQAFVAAGRGLSMLPALALPSARSDLVARPLSPALVRHVTVAVAADGSCSPGVVAMVEALHESARSLHPDLIAAAG